jgi:hypothetical protein
LDLQHDELLDKQKLKKGLGFQNHSLMLQQQWFFSQDSHIVVHNE